jgi:hypothetical protein
MTNQRYAKLELETTQGNETTPSVVATKDWYVPAEEVGILPAPSLLDRSDEIRQLDGRVVGAQNEYAPTGSINLRAYTRYLGFLFLLLFGEVTTIEGNGTTVKDPLEVAVPKKAFMHTFKKKPGATPATCRATLAYFDKWIEARGMSVGSMAFSLADDGVKAAATTMANYIKRLAVDPADEPLTNADAFAVLPFRRRNLKVETPSLAATKVLDSIDFSLEQTLEAVRPLGVASGWPGATERANGPEGFLRLQGSLARRDFDVVDWDALIAASVFGLKFIFESEQLIPGTETGTHPYAMYVSTASAQFTGGGPEALKQQARHESSYDWQAGTSEAAKSDVEVTIVNDVASYVA